MKNLSKSHLIQLLVGASGHELFGDASTLGPKYVGTWATTQGRALVNLKDILQPANS